MLSFEYTISDPVGLHLKSAGALAKIVKPLKSKVMLSFNDRIADASKTMLVVSMGVITGSKIVVSVEGEDELESYKILVDFFTKNL